jgi:CubicO group peptidase (beta-lactamase class C family)
MWAPKRFDVEGSMSKGFEPVRQAFIENFTKRNELGGACCIYQDGEKVVDLWGGVKDRVKREPWCADTMAIVHSATKGLAAMVMARLRATGMCVLARVRAERQRGDHGAAAARASSGAVRLRRTRGP